MENGKNYFRSLAPDNNAENVGSYAAWLHSVATDSSTNQDYGNIALTGDIGIGKSSIVRTYEKNKNYKFVYITAGDLGYRFEKDEITGLPLLSLKKEKANDNSADEQEENAADGQAESEKSAEKSDEAEQDEIEKLSEEIQQKLEKNLLEQLIALCSSKDIPKSRFQTVPENESTADKRFWQIIYPIFCVIAAFCGFKLIANNFIEKDYIDFIDFVPIMWLILIIFFSLSIGVAVSKLITHYKFTKITLNVGKEDNGGASAEIDIDEGENASLDTNLHEIIYLFEQLAKKKRLFKWRKPVFVIEDVDRYPAEICFHILTRFKQINDMLNSRYRLNHSGYGKHFKFIYTLNDKIFDDSQGGRSISDNDPYKFFDVIIPVIPKLSFANSYSILINDFKDYKIDKGFLKDVSFYIFDFRKLRDIENEFVVYYEKFKNKLDNTQTETTENSEDEEAKLTTTAILAFVMYKIFYKGEYYKLFRTNRIGAPLSGLVRKYLNVLGNEKRTVDVLEGILEGYFEDYIKIILEINDAVENKYKGSVVADDKGMDLNKFDMRNMDFSGQNLNGYDFSERNLEGCVLYRTCLTDVDMHKINLKFVSLNRAVINNSIITNADLRGIKSRRISILNTDISNSNLSGADLSLAELKKVKLDGAIMLNVNLWRASIYHVSLKGANLKGAVLKSANLSFVLYDKKTNWVKAKYNLKTVFPIDFNPEEHDMILDLIDEDLINMDLGEKNLSGAWLERTDLRCTNLKNVIYDETTKWKGARYDFGTKFPDGFNPKERGMILDLRRIHLGNMDLSGKDLSNALLHGANLEKVIYDKTKWEGAKYDSNTKFPDDFKPEEHGMELI